MTTNRQQPVVASQDYGLSQRIVNLPNAVGNQEPTTLAQVIALLLSKQDNVTGGAGVIMDGSDINISLATAGSDYSALAVSGLDYSSLVGTYTRLPYRAFLDYAGLDLDLTVGGDFNVYYKDNGSGIWAIIARREIDGDATTSDGGSWMAVLTTIDPTSVTVTVNSFIPSYSAVDYDTVANADVLDESGNRSPATGYALSNLTYSSGATPAGLKFDNDKLAIDFATSIGEAVSTKVFPSSIIKTYVDEQITAAKDLANHPFSNTIAGISGAPTNAQSAIELLAAENDTQDSQLSALVTQDISHSAHIEDNRMVLGVANGVDALPAFTGSAVAFLGGATDVVGALQNAGDSIGTVYTSFGTTLGLDAFETDFGDGFVILPNDSDAKSLFQATEAELQNLSQGLGQFWAPVGAHSDDNVVISNPGTDTFGGAVVATGARVLLIGQSASSENGIYIFSSTSTPLVRSIDSNAGDNFTPNKTVQVLKSTEEGISGATFAYSGLDNPTMGTTPLTFSLKSKGVVGDNTITEDKLAAVVAAKLNAKSDKFVATVTTDANGYATVTHDLATTDFLAAVWTTGATPEIVPSAEVSDPTVNSVIIGGAPNTSYKVVLIG